FQIFIVLGDVIRGCVQEHHLKLGETLEVIYANAEYLAEIQAKGKTSFAIAQQLAAIRGNQPNVWKAARHVPQALRLQRDIPQFADSVLEKYAVDDVVGLLYSQYPDEI